MRCVHEGERLQERAQAPGYAHLCGLLTLPVHTALCTSFNLAPLGLPFTENPLTPPLTKNTRLVLVFRGWW